MANSARLAPAALLALLLAPPAQAQAQAQAQAGWKFTPAIGLTETFTDNVGLQSSEFAHSQWVHQASPSLSILHTGPRLKLSASHQWNYFAYSHNDVGATRSSQRQYQAAADAVVIDELLFFDASASRGTQSASAFGPQVNNNLYALGNTTDVSTWRVSPYLRHRFGSRADLTARYTRDSVDSGIGALGSSEGESVDVKLASGSLFRTLGWGLSYNRQDLTGERSGNSSSELASANLSYRVARTLSLTATGGYDRYDYQSLDGSPTEGRHWSAGFDWAPSARTRLQLAGGRHFYGKTWNLAASHRSRRTVWSINYNDEITNTRSQFLRPATIDTAAMLDAMFRTSIPDPMERRQAIADYMAANGLTPGLANPTNYFSNRFIRQKGLQAAVVFNGPRSNLTLSAFDMRRTALSAAAASDSQFLPPSLATLNDNVEQRGVSAIMNYTITPRSIAQAGLTATRSRSLTTGIVDNQQALRAGLTRKLGNRLAGAFEVRHVRGSADFGSGRKYHENAISATITMQFSAR
jgi:uncharacterized protein (PEP-CTERM system associated)